MADKVNWPTGVPDNPDIELHTWPPRTVGGQQVGTMATGVLAYHKRLGIGAACTSERSQLANRRIALARLHILVRFAEAHNQVLFDL